MKKIKIILISTVLLFAIKNVNAQNLPCVNDSDFIQQWALHNTGQYAECNVDTVDINACPAWNISKGAGIKVAVVDDGVDMQHDDLFPNLDTIMKVK